MKTRATSFTLGKNPAARRHAAERGLVLWLTLVAMLLFAALAMYVANIGHHVEKQEATQDAADACAIGAAGEMARTFNLIAHDNTEMARLIVAAQMLDSMPQATAYTLADQQAMLASLQNLAPPPNAVPNGAPQGTPPVLEMWQHVIGDLQAQVDALSPVANRYYTNYDACAPGRLQNLALASGGDDIRTSTWYAPPGGTGKGAIWKGIAALDKLSQAAMDQLPETAARGATASGIKVLGDGAQVLCGAVPFRITTPCQRGTFDDFFNPIMNGRIPDAAGGTDTLLHRGPYDSVYGWVSMPKLWIANPGPQQPGPPPAPSAGGFPGGNGPPGPPNGHWIYDPSRYWTQGVFVHENNFFDGTVGGPMWLGGGVAGSLPGSIGVNTQLNDRVAQFSLRKLIMAQNGAAPWSGAVPANRLPALFVPNWLFPMASAMAAAQNAGKDPAAPINNRNAYAAWVRIDINNPPSGAIWDIYRISQGRRYYRPQGAPVIDQFFEVPQTDYSYKLSDGVYIVFTPPVIDPQTGDVTTPATNPVIYLWAGVNLQTVRLADDPTNQLTPDDKTAYIQNPNNWAAGSDLPAPTDLTPEYASPPANPMTPGQLVPGQWCVLGIAAQPDQATAWPAKFHSDNYPRQTALAQAWVFNNHSWDLWTPMWHAQLCPISQYDAWVAAMQDTQGQAGDGDGVNTAELPDFIKQLRAIRPMAPLITH